MTELARRYARALYESAPEVALETSARQMQDQPELWQALCSPAVLPEEKQEEILSKGITTRQKIREYIKPKFQTNEKE